MAPLCTNGKVAVIHTSAADKRDNNGHVNDSLHKRQNFSVEIISARQMYKGRGLQIARKNQYCRDLKFRSYWSVLKH